MSCSVDINSSGLKAMQIEKMQLKVQDLCCWIHKINIKNIHARPSSQFPQLTFYHQSEILDFDFSSKSFAPFLDLFFIFI